MANSTIVVALLFGILVCLQASSCTASLLVSVPAVMTLNGFQQGEGGGGPAACDGQYHSDEELIVSLSSEWFDVRRGPVRQADLNLVLLELSHFRHGRGRVQ
jgi:hypothetical protein